MWTFKKHTKEPKMVGLIQPRNAAPAAAIKHPLIRSFKIEAGILLGIDAAERVIFATAMSEVDFAMIDIMEAK